MNTSRLFAIFAILIVVNFAYAGKRIDLFSSDVSPRAASFRSSARKIATIEAHFEQLSRATGAADKATQQQQSLLDEILQISRNVKSVGGDSCKLEHFKRIQALIEKRAAFHYSSVPFLKYQFWLQYLACREPLAEQFYEAYQTKLSEQQKEDLELLNKRTTYLSGYKYRYLFDNKTKKETKQLISVLLDGSGAFMKYRGAHVLEFLVKHDKDEQFKKEHVEIVLNLCLGVQEQMHELMDIFNEVIVDQETTRTLASPEAAWSFFQVKLCQRIIDHEEEILELGHAQLVAPHSHFERFLISVGRRKKSQG